MISRRTLFLLAAPLLLGLTTAVVFLGSTDWLGKIPGYLIGFLFYWLAWCLLFPRLVLGKARFRSLLSDRVSLLSRTNWPAALLFLIVTAVTLVMYLSRFVHAAWTLVLLAIPCATIDGLCEELLWRGVYVKSFPENPWMGILFPALGFAVWHLSPQLIFPASGGTFLFIISTFFLGLAYGFIAYRTGSAKWTAISHSLNGILALSGMLAPSLITLFHK